MGREEIVVQTEDVKVRKIELQAGESGPCHFHTEVTDNMFGISGEIAVCMKSPPEEIILTPGVHCRIEPGRKHRVRNLLDQDVSVYLLVQGVGRYDFIVKDA